jgi:hypothetical protein
LLPLACSVFPDRAVLPDAGGNAGNSAGGATNGGTPAAGGALSGGTAGRANAFGGSAGRGNDAGASAGGGNESGGGEFGGTDAGGAGGTDIGSAGASTTGGAAGGSGVMGGSGGGGATTGGSSGGTTTCTLKLEASADSYLSEVTNEQRSTFGSELRLRVGGVASAALHAVVAFDLSALPVTADVRSAVLRFALSAGVDEARTLSVYALAQTFSEGRVSWERFAQSAKWETPGGDTAVSPSQVLAVGPSLQAGAAVDFDVTNDVAAIAHGVRPGYGWLLAAGPGDLPIEFTSRESAFPEERPVLVITLCP